MAKTVSALAAFAVVLVTASGAHADAAIAPGQDAILGALVARGITLPGGCKLTAGEVPGDRIRATYDCGGEEVVVTLAHPTAVASPTVLTERFAIVVEKGAPPASFVAALASNVRAQEQGFRWIELTAPSPTPAAESPTPSQPAANLAAPTETGEAPGSAGGSVVGLRAATVGLFVATLLIAFRLSRTGPAKPYETLAIVAITATSFLARLWFSLVNHQSNDDHRVVVDLIRQHDWAAPDPAACMLCSHAKLYHYAWAAAQAIVPSGPFNLEFGNLLNFIAGTGLLLLALAYLRRLALAPNVRVLAYAFLSFNAGVVGIFSQSTNDGFCAVFAAIAIFCLERFITHRGYLWVATSAAATVLAALSKASGWAIFAAGVVVLLVVSITSDRSQRRRLWLGTALFASVFALTVPFAHPYRENLRTAHTPFVNDAFDAPMLRYEVPRTPWLWAFESFATFRLVELLRVPYDEFSRGPFPTHYDSLWSQLHGRMFFLRFDQAIWPNKDPRLLALGRVCLLLGLLPLAALLVGAGARGHDMWQGLRDQGPGWLARDGKWLHLIFVATLIAALCAIVVRYHRLALLFTWMKAIYLFPALLSFFSLFVEGLSRLARRFPRTVETWMTAMVAVSVLDLIWLLYDLS